MRHPKHVNRRLHPDAELWRDNPAQLFYVELDTGSESLTEVIQVQQRRYTRIANLLPETGAGGGAHYRHVTKVEDVFLLYVTLSATRLNNIAERSQAVAGLALFATLESIIADPTGAVWRTCDGQLVRLPS